MNIIYILQYIFGGIAILIVSGGIAYSIYRDVKKAPDEKTRQKQLALIFGVTLAMCLVVAIGYYVLRDTPFVESLKRNIFMFNIW